MTPNLGDLDSALDWLQSVWEHRNTPVRIHEASDHVADGDQLGAPDMTRAFLARIESHANQKRVQDIEQDCSDTRPACPRCAGTGSYMRRWVTWRNPTWHALEKLHRSPGDRWGPIPRRWWHPTPAEVVVAIAQYGFAWPRTALFYADGSVIPADMAEVFALSAIRKFAAQYHRGFDLPLRSQKSEAQLNAEDAA